MNYINDSNFHLEKVSASFLVSFWVILCAQNVCAGARVQTLIVAPHLPRAHQAAYDG